MDKLCDGRHPSTIDDSGRSIVDSFSKNDNGRSACWLYANGALKDSAKLSPYSVREKYGEKACQECEKGSHWSYNIFEEGLEKGTSKEDV